MAHVSNCLGDFHEVRKAVNKLTAISDGEWDLAPGARLSALESAAYLLTLTGCLPEGRLMFGRVKTALPETGFQDVGGQNIYTKARIEHMAGAWSDALETIRSGAISLDFAGLQNNLAWLRILEAEILTDQAHLDEAAQIIQAPLLSPECVLYELLRQCRAAKIALTLGDHARAEDILLERLDAVRSTGLAEPHRQWLEVLVELHLAKGQRSVASVFAKELHDLAARSGSPATGLSADLADASLGDVEAGKRVTERCEAEGRKFLAGQAHYHLAVAGLDPEAHVTRALELFASVGAVLWTRRAASKAKELGIAPAAPKRPPAQPGPRISLALTPTEVQLVRLLQQGLTNRQVSSVMHYSPKTIEVYLSRLYQKIGCHFRVELVLAAERGELAGFDS